MTPDELDTLETRNRYRLGQVRDDVTALIEEVRAIQAQLQQIARIQPRGLDGIFSDLAKQYLGQPKQAGVRRTWGAQPIHTKAQVLESRATVVGCCDRFGDMMPCDCLERAEGAGCMVCEDRGYTNTPSNGWEPIVRCPRGCPVQCSVCRNPNCTNPNGQH